MPDPEIASPRRRSLWPRWLLLAGIVAGFLTITYNFHDDFSLEAFAARETQLRRLIEDHPVEVFLAAYGVYAVATGLSIPGATVLTLVYGWLFGFWRGMVLVSFASTTGATLAFLLSRFLLRDAIQHRFGDRLLKFNAALERDGPYYLLTLRLIPAVPFFVINAVMGLTPIKTRTFWWVSQLGMLPGTAVYVSAGANVPDLKTFAEQGLSSVLTWPMLLSFTALGLLPLVIRVTLRWLSPRKDPAETV